MKKMNMLLLAASLLTAASLVDAMPACSKNTVPQTADVETGKVIPSPGNSQRPIGTTIFMPRLPQPF